MRVNDGHRHHHECCRHHRILHDCHRRNCRLRRNCQRNEWRVYRSEWKEYRWMSVTANDRSKCGYCCFGCCRNAVADRRKCARW